MERTLRKLYEYQRFENDPRLKKMLDDALSRYSFSEDGEGELSDDEAGLLNAAGSTAVDRKRSKENQL